MCDLVRAAAGRAGSTAQHSGPWAALPHGRERASQGAATTATPRGNLAECAFCAEDPHQQCCVQFTSMVA